MTVVTKSRCSSLYTIKISRESRVDDTSLWRNGCSRRGGERTGGERSATVEKKKKGVECGEGGRRGAERKGESREGERSSTTEKRRTDVVGERNAAGTSGRKLGGRVRR